MNPFTREGVADLLAEREGPCLSLFVPSRPGEGAWWRQALATAEDKLLSIGFRAAAAAEFLAPARAALGELAPDAGPGTLALFLGRGWRRLYHLPFDAPPRVALGRLFLITPLLPLLSGDGAFHVLALSSNRTRLLRCTRETVAPVAMPGAPANLDEALARHDVDEVLNYHVRPLGAGRWAAIFNGHGVGIDDAKDDLLLYFRAIGHALKRAANGDRAPLVLAAVGHLHPLFRRACDLPGLLPEGLPGCPDRLSDDELRRRAWALVEPVFGRRRDEALATYRRLSGTGRTASAVEEVVPAAWRGEIETLFVATDRTLWGQIDPGSGRVVRSDEPIPRDDDLLNVASASVLRHGGVVYPLPAAETPEGASLAGIRWLPHHRRQSGA